MIFGYILIGLGVFFLLKNVGVIDLSVSFWYIFYPLFFIFLGLCLVLGISKLKKYWKQAVNFILNNKNGKSGPER
ncbi:MAG: hypothetical protein A3B99_00990 [Candidatus Yanofskybacteria bacterium RIFCSPHIGHO2_02_FULL_44_12b]|uniref:LiaI-LiaF-like transmembrane region domain-containing protein n=2 Tax=Candidatus Yanofskyibacteriota TaxID=1752733 RepID=A0A1F8GLB5_9BACT|nr:MAG: hypothetical protein UW79_C0015G0004 [Candidatus Yanofskybacteria bacterium GW2011_GWA2_44_9]OGN04511.1 MAG: hypothetical protein A2659_02095 [Candidatus Yanofskybacteria bacterium RIFCSPHIGHO2_01_FULL_44_24]OGN15805.1 MAG: hypothetical protein A3B99_00990 [Candidatus Yanofskybacteria bacterium RIFCSPHIGHO2_02_FULL_44_12b]OGN26131.1 MAG: hypothetical protein A2925_05010 [Candidatus Yanofskybacteria bacterium RIFCSPLOWO2_01_FULL_44_22]